MEKIVYVPEYDFGWKVTAIPVRNPIICGGAILLNGNAYGKNQLFRTMDAAWKWIGKIHVPESDIFTFSELCN